MSDNAIHAAIACNLDTQILQAALPLLESERVAAIEWSFDTLYRHRNIPEWFVELLLEYGKAGRLIGHGVFFSLFSGRWTPDQDEWLRQLAQKSATFQFDHVTEHFGFMTGADFHNGAPLGVPMTDYTLALGQERLARIADAAQCPVGLENLAFAYCLDEVKYHGEFLERLVAPVDGFVILDLHNLYCQIHNFDVTADELLAAWPLHLVREIHISGGSWDTLPHRQIRRDTHDDAVPEAVFALLEQAVPICPNLKYVVLEQLGNGLQTPESQAQYQRDFERMDQFLDNRFAPIRAEATFQRTKNNSTQVATDASQITLGEGQWLYEHQRLLANILETAPSATSAHEQLMASSLANTAWKIEHWDLDMLETARQIAQKWKGGWG
jgi:uncharacterized protein